MRASAIPAEMAAMPPEPVRAMPEKALMIPKVVPKRPTKGAVDPMVARPERPRLRSARLTAVARWMARLAASTAASLSLSASPISSNMVLISNCISRLPGLWLFLEFEGPLIKLEVDRDGHDHGDGDAVEQGRGVDPLLHRLDSGGVQQRKSPQHFHVRDPALGA